MCGNVMTEKQRNVGPHPKPEQVLFASMDQFMRIGIADLTKENAASDKQTDFVDSRQQIPSKRPDDKRHEP